MLPESIPGKCRRHRLPDSAPITVGNAPAASLPLRFILTALAALGVAIGWLLKAPELVTQYHYSPHAIAFAHLLLLGFALSLVMGLLYQLAPVALQAPLYSERMARWQWWLHTIGFAGMVVMFARWNMKEVGHFGSAFGLGVALFAWNLGRTLLRVPRWTPAAVGIACSIAWLGITTLVGLFLACVKCWPWISPFALLPQLHAHAHLGVLGIFITLIVAVSFRLVPMFVVSNAGSDRRAFASILLLNLGTAAVVGSILFESRWKLAATGVTILGLLLYAVEMRVILRARQRPQLDWGLRTFLAGIILLVPIAALAIFLSLPGIPVSECTLRMENLYAVLALFGLIGMGFLGMLGRILPFFVWFARYRSEIGLRPVPQVTDLYSPRVQRTGFWLHIAGVVALAAGAAIPSLPCTRVGALLLAGAGLAFAINTAFTLSHFRSAREATPAVPIGSLPNARSA